MVAKEKPAATYLGDGSEYLNGIPSRDLSVAEYDAMTDEQRELLDASALYDVKAPAAEKAGKSSHAKAEPVVEAPFIGAEATGVKEDGKK